MKKYLLTVIGILSVFSIVYFAFIKDGGIFGGDDELRKLREDSASAVKYGLTVDSFHVVEDKVDKNQLISDIFLKHHVPYDDINEVLKKGKDVFDVRKFRADQPYTVFCSKDSTKRAQCFVY